jgi:ribonuclease T1
VKLLAALLGASVAFAAAVPDIAHRDLPLQAQRTLALVKAGGPYPYAQDGRVFANREAALPAQKRGYYREYTVPTPGLESRGARRLIAGRGGDYYYTHDHYRTFRRIRE